MQGFHTGADLYINIKTYSLRELIFSREDSLGTIIIKYIKGDPTPLILSYTIISISNL